MNRLFLGLLSALFIVRATAFAPHSPHPTAIRHATIETRQHAIWDTINSMYTHWGKKATASHILFKPSQFPEAEARVKLLEIKAEVGDDPEKFAAAAREWR